MSTNPVLLGYGGVGLFGTDKGKMNSSGVRYLLITGFCGVRSNYTDILPEFYTVVDIKDPFLNLRMHHL